MRTETINHTTNSNSRIKNKSFAIDAAFIQAQISELVQGDRVIVQVNQVHTFTFEVSRAPVNGVKQGYQIKEV